MNDLLVKLRRNLGLTMILIIGLGVEFSNFQSMFFRFMSLYRADWGAFNHIPAMALSAFLLLCIVIFGIRRQVGLSWFLAMLTCVISFAVYSRMDLSWQWEEMSEVHFVILILSGMLPLLVAYSTHQITHDNDDDSPEADDMLDEMRKLHRRNQKKSALSEFQALSNANFQNQFGNQYAPNGFSNGFQNGFNPQNFAPNGFNNGFNNNQQPPYYQPQQPVEPPQQEPPQNKYQQTPPIKKATVIEMPRTEKKGHFEIPKKVVEEMNKEKIFAEKQRTIFPEKVTKTKEKEDEKPAAKLPKPNAEVFESGKELEMQVVSKSNTSTHEEKIEKGHIITCARCGKEAVKKSKNAKYCSEDCRLDKVKHFEKDKENGSGFVNVVDDYEDSGVMEWVNIN